MSEIANRSSLPLFEFLHELQPVVLVGTEVARGAQRVADVVAALDVFRQIRGDEIALPAGEVVHLGLILGAEVKDLRGDREPFGSQRGAAVLLDLRDEGGRDAQLLREPAEADALFLSRFGQKRAEGVVFRTHGNTSFVS